MLNDILNRLCQGEEIIIDEEDGEAVCTIKLRGEEFKGEEFIVKSRDDATQPWDEELMSAPVAVSMLNAQCRKMGLAA